MTSNRSIRRLLAATLIVGVAAAAMPAVAATGPLQVVSSIMVEHRSAAADGTTRVSLAKAARVAPGENIVFVTRYANTGHQPIVDLVIADPIPASIAYRAPSPGSPAPELSVDGKTFGPLSTLRMPLARGGTRVATTDDVIAVRWRLAAPLAPGEHGERAFRAILR